MPPSPLDVLPDALCPAGVWRWLAQLCGRMANGAASRRQLARGLMAVGLSPALITDAASAKNRRKRKRKLKLNEFGCVAVGGKCRGKDSVCCSGICAGQKPKKGNKDKSRCVAHDTGAGCVAGQVEPFCLSDEVTTMGLGSEGEPNCTTSTGATGVCNTTTGNAPFCTGDGVCFSCTKDTECVPFCGQDAVCARCPGGCADEGGTMCLGPNLDSCLD